MTVVHSGSAFVSNALIRSRGVDVTLADNGVDLLFHASSNPEATVVVSLDGPNMGGLNMLQRLWHLGRKYVVYSSRCDKGQAIKIYSNNLDIPNDRTMFVADLIKTVVKENGDGKREEAL